MRAPRRVALLLLALALACSEPTSGPVRVVWGRHACDHCGMAINEPPFAAQIRMGPRKVARFDEFGCAVLWLEAQGGAAPLEFWVRDLASDRWLDARSASYRPNQRTPMAHGLAAIAAQEPGAIDYEAARNAVLAQQRERDAHGRP